MRVILRQENQRDVQYHLYYIDILFFILEKIPQELRGGDFDKHILKQEAKWF